MRHSHMMKTICSYVTIITIGLLVGAVFFRQVVASNFDSLLGDVGDARFNGVILEHWWKVFQGKADWLSPGFFYPMRGVLGYSDANFLNAIPYAVMRLNGWDPFTSYQVVLFLLFGVGWLTMFGFLQGCLKLRMGPALLGTILFCFPNVMAVSIMHTQLLTVQLLPGLAIAFWLFLKDFPRYTARSVTAGLFLSVLIPAIFYSSYYIGWFTVFLGSLFILICMVWSWMHAEEPSFWRRVPYKRLFMRLTPFLLLGAVSFIPFLMTYLPSLKQFGGRSFQEISSMLPTLLDFMNVDYSNWLWGSLLDSSFSGLNKRPMAHELAKGLPWVTLIVFLGMSLFFIKQTSQYIVMSDFRMRRRDHFTTTVQSSTSLLAAAMAATVMLCWLLLLKIEGYSLWWLVKSLVPGAGAIRAVFRFQLVLTFPVACVLAIGFDALLANASRGGDILKRVFFWGAIVVCGILVIVEQFNTRDLACYSKKQQLQMLQQIALPPASTKIYALLPDSGSAKDACEAQVDAMILAQKFDLKTINGYSGQFPPGWMGIYDYGKANYGASLSHWIRQYQLADEHLYFYDIADNRWVPYMGYKDVLPGDGAVMHGPLADRDFSVTISAVSVPRQWQPGQVQNCTVIMTNRSKVVLSSIGGDLKVPGKYAVRLSYRWIEQRRSESHSVEFVPRSELPAAVGPGADITVPLSIVAPQKRGKYWLEIEAVQELVAWFKDKGAPGLQLEVDVK